MNMLKIAGVVLMIGVITTFGSEIGERFSLPGAEHLVPTAEAIVGRPLTPVSVAGVGRRTARRCRRGVYDCRLHGTQSLDILLGQTSSGAIRLKGHGATSSYRPADVRS